MAKKHVLGIDLCGPATTANTGIALCSRVPDEMHLIHIQCDDSDEAVLDLIRDLAGHGRLVVGLDAPLSYQPGGGDRARDKALRKEAVARGMHPSSIV